MEKEIYLKEIEQQIKGEQLILTFFLEINGLSYELWYHFDKDIYYGDQLCERCDSLVVTFLLYAMKNDLDFRSEYPISEKLYYQLIYHVIPQIYACNKETTSKIKIKAPKTTKNYGGKFNGTGVSCGVDSLTTIYEYTDMCELEDYKITHLLYFKTGAHDGQIGHFDQQVEDALFHAQLKTAERFSKNYGYKLIIVDSNLNEVLTTAFGFSYYEQTHTFRSCGTMLLMEKLFHRYYYADAYNIDHFACDVNQSSAKYEKWFIPLLSTESMEMYSANQDMNRLEKTKYISNFKPSYDNLLVCWTEEKNCGHCAKCVRTQVALDVLGVLERYKNSFNLDKFYANRRKYWKEMLDKRDKDIFGQEIYEYMVEHNIQIPEK